MKPFRILSSDVLIADVITPLEGNERLQELVAKYKLLPGGKKGIDRAAFEEFRSAIEGHPNTVVPGGSACNVLTTLSKLARGRLAIDFIGVLGKGETEEARARVSMIEKSIDGFTLHPPHFPEGAAQEHATSFVIQFPPDENGARERTIATYCGSTRELLTPDVISENLVKSADAVFLQGALWQKLDMRFPQRLTEMCERHGKEMWLALPTHSRFGEDNADYFNQLLLPKANLVLANQEELERVLTSQDEYQAIGELLLRHNITHDDLKNVKLLRSGRLKEDEKEKFVGALRERGMTPQDIEKIVAQNAAEFDLDNGTVSGDIAIARLKTIFHVRQSEKTAPGHTGQVAFITRGKAGAEIVMEEGTAHVDAAAIRQDEVVNTLGAGDTSFAGFIAGYLNRPVKAPARDMLAWYKKSAELAMKLASEKLKVNDSRIGEPFDALHAASPKLAAEILSPREPSAGIGK